jgi:hypothetical protein
MYTVGRSSIPAPQPRNKHWKDQARPTTNAFACYIAVIVPQKTSWSEAITDMQRFGSRNDAMCKGAGYADDQIIVRKVKPLKSIRIEWEKPLVMLPNPDRKAVEKCRPHVPSMIRWWQSLRQEDGRVNGSLRVHGVHYFQHPFGSAVLI